jgi:4a-hydroxytetrahydrobiopterin dehydratase
MATLRERRCEPCTGATPRLDAAAIATLLPQVPQWTVRDDRLRRTFEFRDFAGAIAFVNRMAEVAEFENHHPDFTVHYREVEVVIWTHAVGGLSENDFILAAKIDGVADGTGE